MTTKQTQLVTKVLRSILGISIFKVIKKEELRPSSEYLWVLLEGGYFVKQQHTVKILLDASKILIITESLGTIEDMETRVCLAYVDLKYLTCASASDIFPERLADL